MDSIVGDLPAQTKRLILHVTSTVRSAFAANGNSSYAAPLLLPLFLFMACIGIRRKGTSAVLFTVLFVPACVNGLRLRASAWSLSAGLRPAKGLLEACLAVLGCMQDNMPVVLVAAGVLCYLAHCLVRLATPLFYLFILAFYYNTVLYSSAANAYFHMGAFFTVLITIPVVALAILSKQVNRFVASLAFAFAGLWGLLQLAMHQSGLPGKRVLEQILDDLLDPDLVSMRPFTVYFVMAMAFSVFVQYSLDCTSVLSTSLESAETKNAKTARPH